MRRIETANKVGRPHRLAGMRRPPWLLGASALLFVGFAAAGAVLYPQVHDLQRLLLAVFLLSMYLQCVAALQSLSLMRITGWRTAWGVIAIAIVLMAVRRAIGFYGLIAALSTPVSAARLAAELVALSISILMVVGIGWLAPLFRRTKDAERALQSSESYLRSLTEALPDMTFLFDTAGRYLDVVTADERLLAVKREELLGKTVREVFPAELAESMITVFQETVRSGESRALEYEVHVPDGTRWFEGRTSLFPGGGDDVPRVMFVTRDITDRIAAQEAYRVLAEQSIQGIGIFQGGRIVYVNAAAAQITGWTVEELLRMPLKRLIKMVEKSDRQRIRRVVEAMFKGDSPPSAPEFRAVRKDGRVIYVEAVVAPCRYRDARAIQVAFIEITERKEIEAERARFLERLRQAQKWESLSTLAGGIAHNFNNLLQSILGFTELSKSELPEESPLQDYLDEIDIAVQRATALSSQMLAYSGNGSFVFETISLSDLVRDMEYVIESVCPERIHMVSALGEATGKTRADRAHLRQLVLNLIHNATEAIGPGGGEITIKTGERPFTAAEFAGAVPAGVLAPGVHPYLEIRDTGCGMDAETRVRAFDPFFSTKFTGRGLGMAAVLGIVRAHHAAVIIDSEPGRGTAVLAVFPALDVMSHSQKETMGAAGRPRDLTGRTVLVVDDEPVVREIAVRLLERAGCRTVVAGSGTEALHLLEGDESFDCAILDWTMPGMDSSELLIRLRESKPGLPVIIASGHDEMTVRSRIDPACQPEAYLQKPFGAKAIIATVAEIFNRRQWS